VIRSLNQDAIAENSFLPFKGRTQVGMGFPSMCGATLKRGMANRRFSWLFFLVMSIGVCAQEGEPLSSLDFTPPAPGSYQLQRIMPVPEGTVLDLDGEAKSLRTFTRDRITLLSFIYTSCTDPDACPRAYQTFGDLKQHIVTRPEFRDKIRFVSLSFDPLRDTPETMQHYGGSHVRDSEGLPWVFLTTPSAAALQPMVEGFGQDVQVVVDKETGETSQELSHVLKVFLIDAHGDVREIYTTSFLLPQVVMNDIETLLLERPSY
jgi:protein SCO1/2